MRWHLSGDEDPAPRIHEASLSLLENPGIRVEHDSVVKLLLGAGAAPGMGSCDLRLPRRMVEEYLALCPSHCTLTDKTGTGPTIGSESAAVFWSVPGMALFEKGLHRPFTSGDMARIARLLDGLESVHAIFGMALDDVPPAARDVAGLSIIARNSRKHIRVLCFSPEGAGGLIEMKRVVGSHPWFSIGFTAHGPLRWTHLALEVFRRTAGAGIPVTVNGEPMAGVSGPVTLAGAAAVGNAEILAGLVVNQLLEPGRPCIYNLGLAHVFDMKTAIAVTGAPENALLAQLAARMGQFYGLPSASWVSTESMCPDPQAALEKMFGFHTHMAGGLNIIWGVGQLESELTLCPAQAVIDDEMIAYARRFQRGVCLDDESLALDVTRSVGIAGSFLEHEHTLDKFRSELYFPSLLCRVRRGQWEKQGCRRLDQRADEIASTLMNKPPDSGLSTEQERELDCISSRFIEQARRDLG
jgi:trimethylamine--corrinoid protein Co-methyltransferase